MDRYFERLADIIQEKKISNRVRFILQDVEEMREVVFYVNRYQLICSNDRIIYMYKCIDCMFLIVYSLILSNVILHVTE